MSSHDAQRRYSFEFFPPKSDAARQRLNRTVQKLAPLVHEAHCTMGQLALAWILRRPEISSCIVGATRPKQLEENAEASGIELDPHTIQRLEEILA